MSNKNLFPLIGDKTEAVDWVVTSKLRPDLSFPSEGQNIFLSATNYPLLKQEHIPLKWLKSDPGFPILLIEPSDIELDWVYHPYDTKKNYYQLRQKRPLKEDHILIVLEDHTTIEEINLINKNHSGEKCFIYRDQENFEMMKYFSENKHPIQFLNSYLFCYQSNWRPDLIVFQKSEYYKCLRPHIVHAIHLGGVIKSKYLNDIPFLKKELWYGTWELFRANKN